MTPVEAWIIIIGASLSEPHTSVTITEVCVHVELKSTPRRRVGLSHENEREGLLPDCRFGVKEN